jgi:hypothetical protein
MRIHQQRLGGRGDTQRDQKAGTKTPHSTKGLEFFDIFSSSYEESTYNFNPHSCRNYQTRFQTSPQATFVIPFLDIPVVVEVSHKQQTLLAWASRKGFI